MRVVAGRLRSRRLQTVSGSETRPTTDRARAGLFDWLGNAVTGSVLDLYAGSGSLGIEALSRNCHEAVFVERNRRSVAVLRENLRALDLQSESQIMAQDVKRAVPLLIESSRAFDLVLSDPPYTDPAAAALQKNPENARLLAPGGAWIIQRDARSPRSQPPGLLYRASRAYGETTFDWFEPELNEEGARA
ncbi:MAG: 16S rRNA (guanine(966)-N(2))-methyltransferase RsmD [bacterium]|nr:16S rRNA (guanine(966)-N(2))-methyltransferase RsmD [bacterium]